MCVQRNIQARVRNHGCRGKTISIINSECMCVSVIQNAKRMRCIVLSSLASLAPPYSSTLSNKTQDFRKKLFNIKCVD
jgi:spore coat polysaccharide biosynthesis protein SpsF (cytidylyltransferase family)